MGRLEALESKGKLFWAVFGIVLVALIGAADALTGREVSFSLFYLLPIVVVTWFGGRNAGLGMSLLSAVVWFGAEWIDGQAYSQPVIRYWNAAVRLAIFAIVTLLLPALKALETEKEIARVDPLTGAANRRHLFEVLQAEAARAQRYHRTFSLAYFDLDSFKAVNDRYGHAVGDRILCAVVSRAKRVLRKTDFLARLGGDEFLVLLPEIGEQSVREAVRKLQAALLEEMRLGGWPVTFSIGVLTYRGGATTADDLVRRADELMFAVKRGRKDAIAFGSVAGEPSASENAPRLDSPAG